MTDTIDGSRIDLLEPNLEDGQAVYELVRRCPPLDVNSAYNYFLLCSHFSATCVIGKLGGEVMSFMSAYRLPADAGKLFIWQVAVDSRLRGQGMAGRMLESLLQREACGGVKYLETTVSPSNIASKRVFERFADKHGAGWHEEEFISREMFGSEAHEEEILFRIGPFELQ